MTHWVGNTKRIYRDPPHSSQKVSFQLSPPSVHRRPASGNDRPLTPSPSPPDDHNCNELPTYPRRPTFVLLQWQILTSLHLRVFSCGDSYDADSHVCPTSFSLLGNPSISMALPVNPSSLGHFPYSPPPNDVGMYCHPVLQTPSGAPQFSLKCNRICHVPLTCQQVLRRAEMTGNIARD